ncbi:TIGR01777 family protein [Kineococcus sp. R8]|uniref:TIGR01777 family oxidoreductase n=1 Tax=Kineococcus siccus TaxID=2696567 RepID=UPI001411C392|nr:TIGR01777 family protein [Kineococcus siccus]
MRVVVSGASGLIGRHLVPSLRSDGHDVLVLVRRPARGPQEVQWDPAAGRLDPAALAGADAVVNLSGVGVGDHRWTPAYRQEILSSRVDTTSTLVTAMLAQDRPPAVLVNASAIGAYGEGGSTVLTEDSPWGDDFLADVVRRWEAATQPAADAGIRVALARTGLLASPAGGAFGRLLTLFHLGVGGRLGSGQQWWSLISMPDEVRALTFLLEQPVSGPVNLTSPVPAHNSVVTSELAAALHRPAVVPVPGFALRAALGEFAGSILMSQRVVPQRLLDAGFAFRHPDVTTIVGWLADA